MSSPFPAEPGCGFAQPQSRLGIRCERRAQPLGGGRARFTARQVTHYDGDDGLPIASLRITCDGRTLVYARGSETNENGRVADPTNGIWPRKQQVWAIDVDAGAPRLLGEMGCVGRGLRRRPTFT